MQGKLLNRKKQGIPKFETFIARTACFALLSRFKKHAQNLRRSIFRTSESPLPKIARRLCEHHFCTIFAQKNGARAQFLHYFSESLGPRLGVSCAQSLHNFLSQAFLKSAAAQDREVVWVLALSTPGSCNRNHQRLSLCKNGFTSHFHSENEILRNFPVAHAVAAASKEEICNAKYGFFSSWIWAFKSRLRLPSLCMQARFRTRTTHISTIDGPTYFKIQGLSQTFMA